MRRSNWMALSWLLAMLLCALPLGCSDDSTTTGDTGDTVTDDGSDMVDDTTPDMTPDVEADVEADAVTCTDGDRQCDGSMVLECADNAWTELADCADQGGADCVEADDTATCDNEVDADYVGEATCITCHGTRDSDLVDAYIASGHPYKLNLVVDGEAPEYPYTELPDLEGTDLDNLGYPDYTDITYVIGGYNWKARFVGPDGYIITGDETDSDVQYNFRTDAWSTYHTGEMKPYNCGSCHTTGWVATSAAGPHQDDLPGMWGLFSEPGVRCEGCHGPGADHADSPSSDNIASPETADCGACHSRGSDMAVIPASGGLIRHHEQYQEMLQSPHDNLDCGTCHDPHASTVNDDVAPGTGLIMACADCHTETNITGNTHSARASCETCHMTEIVKSATSETIGSLTYGDIATHLFAINTDEGATLTTVVDDVETANSAVPVDFACIQCHDDENSAWVQSNYAAIHAE